MLIAFRPLCLCVMYVGLARAFSTRLRKPTGRQSHLTVGALTRIRKLLGIYNQFNSAGCYPLFLLAYLARQRCKSVTRWAFGWVVNERIKLTRETIHHVDAYCQAQNASAREIFTCAMYKNDLDWPRMEVAMVHLRIDELLAARGRTAYWLAVEGGITHSTVYKLRHGKMKTLSLDLIESLCKTLECSPNDLIEIRAGRPEGKRKSKAKAER